MAKYGYLAQLLITVRAQKVTTVMFSTRLPLFKHNLLQCLVLKQTALTLSQAISLTLSSTLPSTSESVSEQWLLNGVNVCYLNSRSLVNKFTQFQAFVYSSAYSIICVTETWLSDHIYDKEILPSKFTIFRKDRESRGSGVLIAIINSLPCLSIAIPSNLEVIAVRVSISNTEVLICTAYCPPNPNPTYLKCLVDFLISLSQNEKNLIITGDFNLPDICWCSLSGHSPIYNLFCDFLFEYNLSQLISGPTHIKGNTLDLLLTNNEHLVSRIVCAIFSFCSIFWSLQYQFSNCQLYPYI